MVHEPLRTLLRCAAELYYRSYRVLDHLETVQRLEATQYGKIAETIGRDLIEIAKPLLETLSETAMTDADLAETLRPELIAFADWFKQYHEMLVYLPVHDAFPETIDCLKIAFAHEYDRIEPSIILGTLFNAYEFDFLEQVERLLPEPSAIWRRNEKVVALQLPVCDRHSPTAWAVLAHELGHALDTKYGITTSVADSLGFISAHPFRAWTEEICADLIAAEFFGPAAILTIISIEHCLHPLYSIHAYSETHPATLARLQVVSEFLTAKYGCDYLSDERAVYQHLWDHSVAQVNSTEAQEAIRRSNDLFFQNVILRITDLLREEIPKRWQSAHRINDESLSRCMERLRKSVPIGAQGERRETLRGTLTEYEKTDFASVDSQITAFELLKEQFRESPLGIPSLLLSCAKRREEFIREFVDSWRFDAPQDRFEQLCKDLARLDKLGVQSLQASATQRALERSLPGAVSEPQ